MMLVKYESLITEQKFLKTHNVWILSLSRSHTNTLDDKTRESGTPHVMSKIPFHSKGRLQASLVEWVLLFCKEFLISCGTLSSLPTPKCEKMRALKQLCSQCPSRTKKKKA